MIEVLNFIFKCIGDWLVLLFSINLFGTFSIGTLLVISTIVVPAIWKIISIIYDNSEFHNNNYSGKHISRTRHNER